MISINTKNLIDVTSALTKYFSLFGIPNEIVSDHETTFQSTQFKEYLNKLNTRINYASSSESNGQVEKTHATIIEILNTNKDKFPNSNTPTAVELSVALYNNTVHSTTGFTPNEIIFNQNNLTNPEEIQTQANNIFRNVTSNLDLAKKNMEKQNKKKEDPPKLENGQLVFLKPNVRTKTQARGVQTQIKEITNKTFKTVRNIKRNKNKIKRIKKQ